MKINRSWSSALVAVMVTLIIGGLMTTAVSAQTAPQLSQPQTEYVWDRLTVAGAVDTTNFPAGAQIHIYQIVAGSSPIDLGTISPALSGGFTFVSSQANYVLLHYQQFGDLKVQAAYTDPSTNAQVWSNQVTVHVVGAAVTLTGPAAAPTAGQSFTLSGTLKDTDGAVIPAGEGVEVWIYNVQDQNTVVYLGKASIDATGAYTFTVPAQSPAGQHTFEAEAVSGGLVWKWADVSVQITAAPTQLSAVATPTTVAINKPITVTGTLAATDNTPIGGAKIQLQRQDKSGNWQDVTGNTYSTATTGAYSLTTSEPLAGTYQYRAAYAGDGTYAGIDSRSVSVKVVSKTSALADLSALRSVVANLRTSVIQPANKNALLAKLDTTATALRGNKYSYAVTTLQSGVLPRMDGYARQGRPDTNDWVKTSAAQAQLYPMVQNLIQEIQVLQNS